MTRLFAAPKPSRWAVRGMLFLVAALLVLLPVTAMAQGPTNLLQNPGFERPYVPMPIKENCRIAAPWVPWYIEGAPYETVQGYRLAPEYKAAFREDFPGNRVRNGELSQQVFHSFGNFQAGVFQQVANITPGSTLRLEMWGMSWSCDKESKGNCGGSTSGDPSPMHFKIGIDPSGGGDALSPAIVWSAEQNAYDKWTLFTVDAVAKSSTVTVFAYAYPDYRSQDNNIYLDDSSLIVLAPPPTPTSPPPTRTPAPTNTPVPTNTPLPTNTATKVPPTATPVPPTATPVPPTATAVPPTATQIPPTATLVPKPTATATPMPTPTAIPPSLMSQVTSGGGLTLVLVGLAIIVVAAIVVAVTRSRGARAK